ncbi:DUF3772 domain-containing protein [Pseudoroseicyclus sp. CXY001]|uniref:DUF3772 domain-containing protein n=1 Tax=Pseudoroseicyclus sp. CXY001 TaxID=3242492 RepID=UPI003570E392
MARRFGAWCLAACIAAACLLAAPLAAQGLGSLVPGIEESPAETTDPAEPPATPRVGADAAAARAGPPGPDARVDDEELDTWDLVAARAASLSEHGAGSEFALRTLRRELGEWRDAFLAEQAIHAGRIETLDAQIAALGPEDADVSDEVTALRETLLEERRRLATPRLLAAERLAEANGLIAEIDALDRAAQAEQLFARGPSPLAPRAWVEAGRSVVTGAAAVGAEIAARTQSPSRWSAISTDAGGFLIAVLIGVVLLWPARRALRRLTPKRLERPRARVARAVLSVVSLTLPVFGLFLLAVVVQESGFVGPRATPLLYAVPQAGISIFLAHWLAGEIFQRGPAASAGLGEAGRRRASRLTETLGWLLGAEAILLGFLPAAEAAGEGGEAATAVLRFPILLLLALVLFRLGQVMARRETEEEEGAAAVSSYRSGLMRVLGQAAMAAGIAGAVLATLGFDTAAGSVIPPAILTLALIAVVVLLQRLIGDLYAALAGSGEDGTEETGPLLPVLLALILALAAVPVLALIWGARVEDLTELWARVREGYALGESRISPTDFLIFLLLFALGYAVTRLFQSTLRAAVLPRTRLDVGARNAIVSGTGYIGVFLAALVAILAVGVDLSSLAIVAGALTVGVGFGLQTIVSNFVSGIILLIERPISEGDWIEAGGQMGIVRAISVRSTRIETFDRRDVIIPNADLVAGQVTNWTRGNAVGRLIVKIGVAYGTDTARVDAILREIAEAQPQVILTPPPQVLFMGFGASSLDFEIRVILREIGTILEVQNNLNHAINARFLEEGIEIPFAQHDLWLRNPETLRQDAARGEEGHGIPPVGDTPAGG